MELLVLRALPAIPSVAGFAPDVVLLRTVQLLRVPMGLPSALNAILAFISVAPDNVSLVAPAQPILIKPHLAVEPPLLLTMFARLASFRPTVPHQLVALQALPAPVVKQAIT